MEGKNRCEGEFERRRGVLSLERDGFIGMQFEGMKNKRLKK
jgi:hypothetical protein